MHMLYQELKMYSLMGVERESLAKLVLSLCARNGRREYIDYYLREGYSLGSHQLVQGEQLQNLEVFDIFGAIAKILVNPGAVRTLHSVYNRSRFVLNFFQLLVWGEVRQPVETITR